MCAITKDVSLKIANMSLLCAILVVCVHVNRPRDYAFIPTWVLDRWGIDSIGVPFFFIVSGFFLVNHLEDKQWWMKAVRKRMSTLMVPFLVLNLFWFPIKYGIHYVGVLFMDAHHDNPVMVLSWKNFLIGIWPFPSPISPVLAPLWYVRALFWLVVFSGMWIWFVRKSKKCALLFLGGIFLLFGVQSYIGRSFGLNMRHDVNLDCLFYFALGVIVRLWGGVEVRKIYGVVLLGVALCIHYVGSLGMIDGLVVRYIHTLFILALIMGIWSFVPARKWPAFLVQNTFPLYVLHVMIIYCMWAVYRALRLDHIMTTTVAFCCCVGGYSLLSCILAQFIKNRVPNLAKYCFGGR